MYTPITHCPAVSGRAVNEHYQQRWVLVDKQQRVISANTQKLDDIQVDIKFGYLVIRAPGMLRLDIPMDVIEDDESAFEWAYDNEEKVTACYDDHVSSRESAGQESASNNTIRVVSEGDLAAQWFSVYLEQPVRLMKKV